MAKVVFCKQHKIRYETAAPMIEAKSLTMEAVIGAMIEGIDKGWVRA
jgi:hypothetical protein